MSGPPHSQNLAVKEFCFVVLKNLLMPLFLMVAKALAIYRMEKPPKSRKNGRKIGNTGKSYMFAYFWSIFAYFWPIFLLFSGFGFFFFNSVDGQGFCNLMGCFPVNFQEAKRPLRAKSVKRPIKVRKRPISERKRPIKAMVLVGISVGCLMGCFQASRPWWKTAPLKRPIKRSMTLVENVEDFS